MGLFARKNIKLGEQILIEKPIYVVDSNEINSIINDLAINIELAKEYQEYSKKNMTKNVWDKLYNMPDNYTDQIGFKSIVGIIASNSIHSNHNHESGIYMKLRLINHGCKPNIALSEYDILENKDHERYIYAIRDILKGEELTVSYITQYSTHDYKINNLQKLFNVKCDCGQSLKPDPISDQNRKELAKLKMELDELGLTDPLQGITISHRMLELIEIEGILEHVYTFGVYYNLLIFNLLKKSSNKKFIKKLLEKLVYNSVLMTTEHSKLSKELKECLIKPPKNYDEFVNDKEY